MTSSAPRLAVLIMLLGMLLFSLNDALGKWLVATYSVGQVLAIRSGASLLAISPFIARSGWRALFKVERPGLQAVRAALSALEVYCFYLAVTYLPLADTMTFWMATPIYVAALSPLILGERVGFVRWAAILVGFGGVIIALEPSGQTLSVPALVAVLGSLAFALMILLGRMLRGTPDVTLVFWQNLTVGALGLALAPSGWVTPSLPDFALLATLGAVAVAAHICVNRALKLADAAAVAPLQYTLLLWAIIFGWWFFGDVPRPAMMLGATIIVGAGLFIFFREQALRQRSEGLSVPPHASRENAGATEGGPASMP